MEKEKRIRGLADTLLILLITIVTGTILIMACGADPAESYSLFFRGIFGTPASFCRNFCKSMSIDSYWSRLCCGLPHWIL